ncbi:MULTISPECIES: CYTH and CHAD domain-containing protein [Rhodococcus]|uniref:CYTH and CHAD domain-containing protein n=1 Tax=Rhodococcus TaxID=1827 RepID=UPI0029539E0B|nr:MULTISPECIES: CYTH and CHAD domain-containing protein [Rhodococcus]MDV7246750.1 CYTH and CHAD domain-containing protein [Rhodococcus oxybenzonivorans]MDV7337763.1 CYTH and CHAD domain-containing protein [Rhodococcus oxybenzonivorans]MDV7347819.1 CYTH and CHAD domain-containing protein [Rhodococcus oxybenzonivorans]MDV8031527.1 CYTH and CHAD domain-containing protein [Rhodococcus sp. IEGM 27]
MLEAQREREDKYEVGLDFAVPDLARMLPADGRIEQATINLDSVYYDTADQDLFRHHVTLRRRSGGSDAGWHLKVPADKARTELRLPPSNGDSIPAELAELAAGVTLGKSLHPVAMISTVRSAHRLYDHHGTLLAEVADDRVQATALGESAQATVWREVEVELGEAGDEKLLKRIGKRLSRGDAHPSHRRSKLDRALSADHQATAPDADRTARAVLLEYLDAQVQAIIAGDVALRGGRDPIHPTRVGIRRLRSTLRVYSGMFDPAARDWLDAELSWYAGLLGQVRDRQVQRERFAAAVAALPTELVLGPVAARIENDLLAEQLHHRAAVMEALGGDRYRELLTALTAWRTSPPLAEEVTGRRSIERGARRAGRKAVKRVVGAAAGTDDAALHRARKAAKRARYAAELAQPVLGKKKAKKKVATYKKMQEVLGEHQDSVVAADILRGLGARAGTTPGENGFTFGLLYGLEQQAARQARVNAARLVG